MSKLLIVASVALVVATAAQALEPIEISATKKTADTRKSTSQALWRGSSRATEKSIFYRFDLIRRSGTAPEYADVQWMVLVEGALGHVVAPRTSGESHVGLPLNQSVSVETEDFSLSGREWTSGPNPGTVEEQIIGYGVRVLDEQGTVLAEKYGPPSVKSSIDWQKLKPPAGQPAQAPVRGRMQRRLLVDPDVDEDRP